MLEWFALVFLFLLGLVVGSHVNVLVLRFGFSETGSRRSECAQCTAQIPWYDLVPVFSYCALRGRCRSCGSGISIQYPLVEISTGIFFILAYLVLAPFASLPSLVMFSGTFVFFATAVALTAYDIRHTLVPLPFVAVLGASALLVRIVESLMLHSWSPLFDAALGAVILAGFFALVSIVTRGRGMGMGDAYVAAGVGAFLGVSEGIGAAVIGVWAATAGYLFLMYAPRFALSGGKGVTMKTELPFAPWLILGCVVAFSFGISILDVSEWIAVLVWR